MFYIWFQNDITLLSAGIAKKHGANRACLPNEMQIYKKCF